MWRRSDFFIRMARQQKKIKAEKHRRKATIVMTVCQSWKWTRSNMGHGTGYLAASTRARALCESSEVPSFWR